MLPINSGKVANFCDAAAGEGEWYVNLFYALSSVALVAQCIALGLLADHSWSPLMLVPAVIWIGCFMLTHLFDSAGYAKRIPENQINVYKATKIYYSLNEGNKVLAEPLVNSIYELDKIGDKPEVIFKAMQDRLNLLNDIQKKDVSDRMSNIVIDNSDVEAVRAILSAYKEMSHV